MNPTQYIVITSISGPNEVLKTYADGSARNRFGYIVVGDTISPADFELRRCDYYSIDRQLASGFEFAQLCPTRHYARKNIGYLLAMRAGAEVIRDTDDDNLPRQGFWDTRTRLLSARLKRDGGWVNVYRWFTDVLIWPRGLPLCEVKKDISPYESLLEETVDCPIQQGLADENPDVDALYRLLLPLPQSFKTERRVALGERTWCPFNSQNTTWFREAFPLLYLPAHCSFRMTDIWRSFVAQRIAWENGWKILIHDATVWQERNEHDLMKDFTDEIPGYLHNDKIAIALESLTLRSGTHAMGDNLRVCYGKLCDLGHVGAEELPLLEAWLTDLEQVWRP